MALALAAATENAASVKKRILVLIKGLGRGGAEQLILNASPYFDRSRFEYEIAFLLPWKNALVEELETSGLRVHCLEAGKGIGWMRRLRRLVREREIDLVHVHSPYAAIGARVAIGGVPIVYTEHNGWDRYHRATYWGNVGTYWINDHVFAVSEQVRTSIEYPSAFRFLSLPPRETLYHGSDPAVSATWGSSTGVREEFGIPASAPVVGTVANFKAHKGYEYWLRAAALVRRSVPDVRFMAVGQGPLESEVRRQAADLGLDGTVIFTGFREDVPRLAASFDIFLLSSIHEGLSIALLEAMSLGKPAVVTSVGGLPEVVEDGHQGFLVPPADPVALADRVALLIGDDDLRSRMGVEARRRAADFDIRKAVRRAEEVYEGLLR